MIHTTPGDIILNLAQFRSATLFGCRAYAHVQKDKRHSFESKSRKCIFLGYPIDYKGWKCWEPSTGDVFISCDVRFVETEMPGAELELPGPRYEPMSGVQPGSVGELGQSPSSISPSVPPVEPGSTPSSDDDDSDSDSGSEPDLDDPIDCDFVPSPGPDMHFRDSPPSPSASSPEPSSSSSSSSDSSSDSPEPSAEPGSYAGDPPARWPLCDSFWAQYSPCG